MFSIFKRKQKYVNVFMNIMYNKGNSIIQRHGISKVKWPIFPISGNHELQDIADELANTNGDSNVVIISEVYK